MLVKPRVHKFSESELDPSTTSAEQENLSDYTPIHRQLAKPVNAKIDAAKPQAPLNITKSGAVTPRNAKPAQNGP